MSVFALVDCNNFYASCEKLFDPKLQDRPVVEPTDDSRVLVSWALRVLRSIYRTGYGYHKAGVMLANLMPRGNRQLTLLGSCGHERAERVMAAFDRINERYGRGTVKLAAEGVQQSWRMRRNNLSPAYTTSWSEVATVCAA